MTNEVRDIRQIYWDDKGWDTNLGDLWVSTHVQLLTQERNKFDMVLEVTLKTTTGWIDNARYTDTPLNYFLLGAAKSFKPKSALIDEIRFAVNGGFYVWQTNMVEASQDEGICYNFGMILKKKQLSFINEYGGYSCYDAYQLRGEVGKGNNDPQILRSRLEWEGSKFTGKLEYQHGFRNYKYETFRLGVVYRWLPKRKL